MTFQYQTSARGGQTILIHACSKEEADRRLALRVETDHSLATPSFWWNLKKVFDDSGKEVKLG
jgi:hypothetical protein